MTGKKRKKKKKERERIKINSKMNVSSKIFVPNYYLRSWEEKYP